MKVMIFLGTRPEIIRLSRIIPKLDHLCRLVVVHTNQNHDPRLSDIFFQELDLRPPDYSLGARGDFGQQAGIIFSKGEAIIREEAPDAFLILGDTNSGLAAVSAKRQGISVYHLEAGNRCYDDRVPEEVNRRIIDHSSDVWMPYTERSRANLLREGIPGDRIFVVGNPITEVMDHYAGSVDRSSILEDLNLEAGKYFLVTLHRAENVDSESRLVSFCAALERLEQEYALPVIVSTHPRTKSRLEASGLGRGDKGPRWLQPFGFFDFVHLEKNAFCVLSDSGTVQEECAVMGVPNVTLRDVTERPETVECGGNMLSGADPERILLCVRTVLGLEGKWTPPREYLEKNVSDKVVRILLGHLHGHTI